MPAWIDFKKLRERISFEEVLRHYKVEIKRKGKGQHLGFCPLPKHQGKRNSPSFSANLERGIFHCFGCGAKGNLLEFAALVEGIDPNDGRLFHSFVAKLQERFAPDLAKTGKEERKFEPKKEADPDDGLPVIINAPLDFELKGLNSDHPYLLGRGFTKETIARFGLGFASRGSLKDRIAIPLLDQDAKLVGYSGRVVDDNTITEDNPRYKLPGRRKREGRLYDFKKTLLLYNGHRIKAPVDDLAVVEGFASVWWFDQCGQPNVVSTLGSDVSDRQTELIVSLVKPSGRIWIVPDGDPAGERFATDLLTKLAPHRSVRWKKMAEDKQPTDLSPNEVKACFEP